MPPPQPIPVPAQAVAAMTGQAAGQPGHAPMTAVTPLRHPAAPMRAPAEPIIDGNVALEMQTSAQPAPLPVPPPAPPRGGAPAFAHRTNAGLFAEARPTAAPPAPPQMTEPPRPSLFSKVTGAFHRRPAAPMAVEPVTPRHEPMLQHSEQRTEAPRGASVRLATGSDEPTLEIPAFLRRQTS